MEDILLLKRDFVLDFELSMLAFISSFSIVDFILDFRSSMSEFIFLIDGMSDFYYYWINYSWNTYYSYWNFYFQISDRRSFLILEGMSEGNLSY